MKTLLSFINITSNSLKGGYDVEIRHMPDDCSEFLTEYFTLYSLEGVEKAIANFRREWSL